MSGTAGIPQHQCSPSHGPPSPSPRSGQVKWDEGGLLSSQVMTRKKWHISFELCSYLSPCSHHPNTRFLSPVIHQSAVGCSTRLWSSIWCDFNAIAENYLSRVSVSRLITPLLFECAASCRILAELQQFIIVCSAASLMMICCSDCRPLLQTPAPTHPLHNTLTWPTTQNCSSTTQTETISNEIFSKTKINHWFLCDLSNHKTP